MVPYMMKISYMVIYDELVNIYPNDNQDSIDESLPSGIFVYHR